MQTDNEKKHDYTPLQQPIPITEHDWTEDVVPVVCTRTMAYNHENYIRDCLDGILMQKTTFPVRVVIHDDASTDKTAEIIREYEGKYPKIIKVIYQTENTYKKPDKYLRRKPVRDLMTGRYVALCEGDDYWIDPLKLQKQVDFLENNPEYVLCAHMVRRVDHNNNIIRVPEERSANELYSPKEIFHKHFPPLSVLHRNVKPKYPSDMKSIPNGDAMLFGMLSSYGGAASLNFIGASYRMHSGGIYSLKPLIKNQVTSIKSRRAMAESSYFQKWQKREINKEIWRRKLVFSIGYIKKGELRKFFKILFA